MADYSIELGVKLDTSDIASQIAKVDNKYKVNLGVDVKVDDIKKRISAYNQNTNNTKLKLGIKLDTKGLKEQIKNLNLDKTIDGKSTAVPIDTESVKKSLAEVKTLITDIKTAFGTLDNNGDTKSLIASVNQIATALERATNKSDGLAASLKQFANKDFSINLGGSNSVSNNAAYGDYVKDEVLPTLKKQEQELAKYIAKHFNTNEISALNRLAGKDLGGVSGIIETMDRLESPLKKSESLKDRMREYKTFINSIIDSANMQGIDLSPVLSEFDKLPNELIETADKIRNGTQQVDDSFEKLKTLFGSSVDGEQLSTQLNSIVVDLGEIKTALQGLSSGVSLDGLTQSFDRLSTTLEQLMTNAKLVQDVLGSGMSGRASGSIDGGNTEKAIQDQKELAQVVQQSANTVTQGEQRKQQEIQETTANINQLTNVTKKLNSADVVIQVTEKGLDEAERKITKITKFDDGKPISIETTVSQDFKEVENDLKRLKTLTREIGSSKVKLQGLDVNKNINEINQLEKELNELQSEYNELFAKSGQQLNKSQFDSLTQEANKAAIELDRIKAKMDDVRESFAKEIKVRLNDGDFNVMSKIKSDAQNLAGTYPKLESSIKEVENALRDMESAVGAGSADKVANVEKLINAHTRYEHALKNVQNTLKESQSIERQENNSTRLTQEKEQALLRLKGLFEDNSEAAKKFAADVQTLEARINDCGNLNGMRSINKDITTLNTKIKQSNLEVQTFGSRLKEQFDKYSAYFSVATLFMYAEQGLRDMFEQIKLIDSAMTELKKVTDESNETYAKFLTNASSRAKEIGTTIDGLVESTADFARLGYEFQDAQGLAEVANIYAVVGDDIDSVEQATQSLISTLTAFKNEMGDMDNTEFALSIVDKMNEVANNFAISSGGIGEALSRSASSMMAANNSLDETIALITAANTVVDLCHLV